MLFYLYVKCKCIRIYHGRSFDRFGHDMKMGDSIRFFLSFQGTYFCSNALLILKTDFNLSLCLLKSILNLNSTFTCYRFCFSKIDFLLKTIYNKKNRNLNIIIFIFYVLKNLKINKLEMLFLNRIKLSNLSSFLIFLPITCRYYRQLK